MSDEKLEEIQKIKYELWGGDLEAKMKAVPSEKRIVAEGDSWFDYPPGLDILDQLKRSHKYEIYKVAEAGDTIENMAWGTEYRRNFSIKPPQLQETLDAIRRHGPRAVLLSGGGNDIAGDEFEAFLNHQDSDLPVLRQGYVDCVIQDYFQSAYQHILDEIWDIDPSIHVFGHGYAHPVPDGRGVINFPFGFRFIGPWLRPALTKKRILDASQAKSVVQQMIDRVNDMLEALDARNPNFHYIDLRPYINDDDWVNELHLSNRAYQVVADCFHLSIQAHLAQGG